MKKGIADNLQFLFLFTVGCTRFTLYFNLLYTSQFVCTVVSGVTEV